MSKNTSPQSKRLQIFIDSLGFSAARFARECNINSPRTMTKILSEGTTPSKKVLDKIIKAFPMLNHDWVVLGYGEMIVKGLQTQPITTNALEKSTESTYQFVAQQLKDHDYALNELKIAVEKDMSVSTEQRNMQTVKLDHAIEKFQHQLDNFRHRVEKDMSLFKEDLKNQHQKEQIENINLIKTLDVERKKLALKLHEERKKTNRQFWNEITEDFDNKIEGNWKRYEQKMIETNEYFSAILKTLSEKIDTNTQTAIDMITNSGKDNTAKALKALGEHSININPKL